MTTDRSVELQEAIARQLWREQIAIPDLFKRCRKALGLDVHEVTAGPLHGIITARRLRRVEVGQEDVPPRAWQVYAELLASEGHNDLVEQIKQVCHE